jgi:hypothetical protein
MSGTQQRPNRLIKLKLLICAITKDTENLTTRLQAGRKGAGRGDKTGELYGL